MSYGPFMQKDCEIIYLQGFTQTKYKKQLNPRDHKNNIFDLDGVLRNLDFMLTEKAF